MRALAPAIAAGIVLLVGLAVLWMWRSGRRRAQLHSERALALGFRVLSKPNEWLVERLAALHRGLDQQPPNAGTVYERAGPDYQMYLFDSWDEPGDGSGSLSGVAVAVLSLRLALPRFALLPRVGGGGHLAALANRLLDRWASQAGGRVEFPSHFPFERRYALFGPSKGAIRAFFDDDRLRRLSEHDDWIIVGEGDLFTFGKLRFDRAGRGLDHTDLAERVQEALRALEALASD